MYNPFVPLTQEVLPSLEFNGMLFLIIQRFSWPGLKRSTTFLVTPYDELELAKEHEDKLQVNEGKLLDLKSDYNKVLDLLNGEVGFKFFLDKFKETNWNKRMIKEYQRNITNYLASRTSFTRKDAIDINFALKFGHLIAEIRTNDKSLDVPAIYLIT